MGVAYLWPQYFGYELTLQEFLWTYRAFTLTEELRFFSLSTMQGRKIIDKYPSNNKGWKTKFFQVLTSGLYKADPESDVVLPTVW